MTQPVMIHQSDEYIPGNASREHPRGLGVICGRGKLWFRHSAFSQELRLELDPNKGGKAGNGFGSLDETHSNGGGHHSWHHSRHATHLAATWKVVQLSEAETEEHKSRLRMLGSLGSRASTMSTMSSRDIHHPKESVTEPLKETPNPSRPRHDPDGGIAEEELDSLEQPLPKPTRGVIYRVSLSDQSKMCFHVSRELPSKSLQMLEFYNLLVQVSRNEADIKMPDLGAGGIGQLFGEVDDDNSRSVDKQEVIKYLKQEGWWHKMGNNNRQRDIKLEKAWVVISSHTIQDIKVVLEGPRLQLDDGHTEVSLKSMVIENELAKEKAKDSTGRRRDIPPLLKIPHPNDKSGKPIRCLFRGEGDDPVAMPPDPEQAAHD